MTDARITELEARIAAKLAYGTKCTRDMNELARLQDAARSPFMRGVRKYGFIACAVVVCAIYYAPFAIAAKTFFVGG